MTDTEKRDLVQWFFRLRDRMKGEAQKIVDTAIDKLAPSSPAPEAKSPWADTKFHTEQLASTTCTCGNAKPSMRYHCLTCAPENKRKR